MTESNDSLRIDTPENVAFDYDVAGIGSRFLAALVDTGILVVLQAAVLGTVSLVLSLGDGLQFLAAGWIMALLGLVSFILLWGYYIGFELLWNGQSPGKRWVGLRVIRVDGTPISASESIIRNLVRIVDFLPLAYGIGVVSMFVSPTSRRLGDLAAGTVVVHDRKQSDFQAMASIKAMRFDPATLQGEPPPGFPLEKLTRGDLEVIEEFLIRRSELSNRTALARHLLAALTTRLGLPPGSIDPEKSEFILAGIYKAAQSRPSDESRSA